jgi:hypothetical protein
VWELRQFIQFMRTFPIEQTSIEQKGAHRHHTTATGSLFVLLNNV